CAYGGGNEVFMSRRCHAESTGVQHRVTTLSTVVDRLLGGGSVKSRKAAISVRIGAADVRNVKAVAKRLGVRDSDVFRYAVKSSLEQLGLLGDPNVHGRHLLPVFVDAGPMLLRFFDLDAARLVEIVNAGVEDPEALVAPEDLTLLSMAGVQQSY